MDLSKDSLRILKLAYKRKSIDFEDVCGAVNAKSPHTPYAPENLESLEHLGLISVKSKMMPEGYEKMTVRITPSGQAQVEIHKEQTLERRITRVLSIAAIVLSTVSITWQILVARPQ